MCVSNSLAMPWKPGSPCFGSADGVGAAGRVVFGAGLHAAGVAAMIGFCQTEAAENLSSGCAADRQHSDTFAFCFHFYICCCKNTTFCLSNHIHEIS